jgi:predicted transcriptional regulator
MSFTKNRSIIRSPKLKGEIVENILLLLNQKELCIDEIFFKIQHRMQLSYTLLKKYLVYLIDFELVTYDGQRKACFIEEGGFDLLENINVEKNSSMTDYEDMTITLEKEFSFTK